MLRLDCNAFTRKEKGSLAYDLPSVPRILSRTFRHRGHLFLLFHSRSLELSLAFGIFAYFQLARYLN